MSHECPACGVICSCGYDTYCVHQCDLNARLGLPDEDGEEDPRDPDEDDDDWDYWDEYDDDWDDDEEYDDDWDDDEEGNDLLSSP